VVLVGNTLKALQDLAARHRAKASIEVAAVTGSNGKTTTKEMLASIIRQTAPVFATPGNLNSQIGLPLALLDLREEHQFCVLEMGASERGHLRRLSEIARPQFGIITNIGYAHIEFFGFLDKTARAKWELMESLPKTGHAILPANNPFLSPLISGSPCPITLFGEGPGSQVRALDIKEEREFISFILELGRTSFPVRLHTLGRFNVLNALAAAACAWRMGLEQESIQKGLESFAPAPMRMTVTRHSTGALLVNDAYNANPDSMKASLDSFYEHFKDSRRIAVLGSMLELGKESTRLHEELGLHLKNMPALEVHLTGGETCSTEEGARRAGASNSIMTHQTLTDLTATLRARLDGRTAVLFKASRGIGLEKVIEALQKVP
jgi:UDP-N-acetylmuramoyl-tripeptide--D-alanyl-D-alanine ligase